MTEIIIFWSTAAAAEKNTIIGALNAIQSATCVKFVARSNQANYVYVTVSGILYSWIT